MADVGAPGRMVQQELHEQRDAVSVHDLLHVLLRVLGVHEVQQGESRNTRKLHVDVGD